MDNNILQWRRQNIGFIQIPQRLRFLNLLHKWNLQPRERWKRFRKAFQQCNRTLVLSDFDQKPGIELVGVDEGGD
jgi:hypothetical protein